MSFRRIRIDMSLTCAKWGKKSIWTSAVKALIRSPGTGPIISTWIWNAWILDGFQSRIRTKRNDVNIKKSYNYPQLRNIRELVNDLFIQKTTKKVKKKV